MLCERKLPNIAQNHCNAVDVEQISAQGHNYCTILPATLFYNEAVSKEYSEQELESPSKSRSLTRSSMTNNLFPSSSSFALEPTPYSRNNIKHRSTIMCNESMRKISMLTRSKSLLRSERKNSKMYDDGKNQTTQIEMRKFQNVLEEMKLAEKYFKPKLNIRNSTSLQSSNDISANSNNFIVDNKFEKIKTCSQNETENNDDVHPSTERYWASKNMTSFFDLSEQTARGVAELAKDKLENNFVNHILRDKLLESELYLSKVRNARNISVNNVNKEQLNVLPTKESTPKEEESCLNEHHKKCQAMSPNDQQNTTLQQFSNRSNKTSKSNNKTNKNNNYYLKNDSNKNKREIMEEAKYRCELPKLRYGHVHIVDGIQRSSNCKLEEEEEESISWNGSQKYNRQNVQEQQGSNVGSSHSNVHNLLSDTNVYDDNGSPVHTNNCTTWSNNTHSTTLGKHQVHTDGQVNSDCVTGEVALLPSKTTVEDRLNELLEIVNQEHTYVLPEWCDREIKLRRINTCKRNNSTTKCTERKKSSSVLPRIKCKAQIEEHCDVMNNKHMYMPKATANNQYTPCKKLADCNKWRGLGKRAHQELQNKLFRIREHEWASERDTALTFEKTTQVLDELRPLRQQMLEADVLSHYQVRPIEQWGNQFALSKENKNASHYNELRQLPQINNNNSSNDICCVDNEERGFEQKHLHLSEIVVKDSESERREGKTVEVTEDSHKINTVQKKVPARKFINSQHLIHAHSRNIFRAAAHIEHSRKTAAQEMYIQLLREECDKLLLTSHHPYESKVITNNFTTEDELLEKEWKLNERELLELEREHSDTRRWEQMELADVKENKRFAIHHALTNVLDRCSYILVNSTTHAKLDLLSFKQIIEESKLTAEDVLTRPVSEVLEKLSKLFHVTNEDFRRWITWIKKEVVGTTDYASRFRQTDVEIFGKELSEQ